jgi:hypothetical protein
VVAAGPGFVVEMVNLAGRIWRTSGAAPQQVSTFTLASFFNAGDDTLTDPRVIFDAASNRWFASLSDEDAQNVLLAVSSGPDPTAPWTVHTFSATGCADQPRLGVADGVIVLGADVFRSCDDRAPLLGSELWVINKQQLVSGASTVADWTYGPRPDYSSFAPVQSLSPTATEYVVSVDEPRSAVAHLLTVTGIPPAPVQITEVATPAIRPLAAPPDSPQPQLASGARARPIPTNDNRVLDSVWENGKLWFSANDRCQPSGDSTMRSCGRVVELSTATNGVDWDTDLSRKGGGVFFPAIRPDASGNLVVVYGESSSTLLPRVAAVARMPDGTFTGPVTIAQSTGQHTGDRYGDYFGAGRDPANPGVIWVVGETGTAPHTNAGWGTEIGSVVVTPAGRTPPAAVTLPPPAVLAKKGTGRAGKTMLLRYLALADGTGVSASATVTSGKRVVFTRTTAAGTLTNGQSYSVPWHPARTQRGSFRFCVRSVAVDGTQSSQSCAAVTVR